MKYLLPCACGESIPIEISQAGQRVTCRCGQSVEVPTLRAIRALPPAEEENARAAPAAVRPPWTSTQGALFGIGILLTIVGVWGAGYCYYVVQQIDIQPPSAEALAELEEQFDRLPVDRMYEIYMTVREEGIGIPNPPLYVRAQRAEAIYTRYGIAGGIVALVGAATTLASFFVRGK